MDRRWLGTTTPSIILPRMWREPHALWVPTLFLDQLSCIVYLKQSPVLINPTLIFFLTALCVINFYKPSRLAPYLSDFLFCSPHPKASWPWPRVYPHGLEDFLEKVMAKPSLDRCSGYKASCVAWCFRKHIPRPSKSRPCFHAFGL